MTREDAASKGRRYLREGRVVVERVTPGELIVASVRGAGEHHSVTWQDAPGWACTCPARSTCSHLHAVQMVTSTTPAKYRSADR